MQRLVIDQKARVGAWVAAQVEQSASWGDFYAMGVENAEGELVAGVVVNNYNGSNATCHVAIVQAGKGLVLMLRAVADYAFRQCGLKRLTGMVPASNPRALAFDRHLGWEDEYVMPCGAHDGGDLHILVMWPDRCPWLKEA